MDLPQVINFTKMEATGNDYIYIDRLTETSEAGGRPVLSEKQITYLSDRHFGIGGDGVVFLESSQRAEARMKMFNADGSVSAMCGNALRSIAFLVARKNIQSSFLLESDVGLHRVIVHSIGAGGREADIEISLDGPGFGSAEVPYLVEELPMAKAPPDSGLREGIIFWLDLPGLGSVKATLLSMGNPHMVVFVEDPDLLDLESIGPALENHPAFPERMNIEFVSRRPDGSLRQRTFERGSGETLSCGSGACATHVASVLAGFGMEQSTIRLTGGDLQVRWEQRGAGEDSSIHLRGPARIVFEGTVVL